MSTGKRLEAYYDVPDSNGEKIMMHPEVFELQTGLKGLAAEPVRQREVLRALCMTHDGHIAWVRKLWCSKGLGLRVRNESLLFRATVPNKQNSKTHNIRLWGGLSFPAADLCWLSRCFTLLPVCLT